MEMKDTIMFKLFDVKSINPNKWIGLIKYEVIYHYIKNEYIKLDKEHIKEKDSDKEMNEVMFEVNKNNVGIPDEHCLNIINEIFIIRGFNILKNIFTLGNTNYSALQEDYLKFTVIIKE